MRPEPIPLRVEGLTPVVVPPFSVAAGEGFREVPVKGAVFGECVLFTCPPSLEIRLVQLVVGTKHFVDAISGGGISLRRGLEWYLPGGRRFRPGVGAVLTFRNDEAVGAEMYGAVLWLREGSPLRDWEDT